MNERPDAGTPKQHEDCWPIMVRWLPAQPTMADWKRTVDRYLAMKVQLDRQRQQAQPAHSDGRPQTSAPEVDR